MVDVLVARNPLTDKNLFHLIIEKNFLLFLGDHCLIEERELPGLVGALALYLISKNCSPQHPNTLRNSIFLLLTEKSSFIRLSFIDSFSLWM